MSDVSGVSESSDVGIIIPEAFIEKALDDDGYSKPYQVYPTPRSELVDRVPSHESELKIFLTNGGPKKRYANLLRALFSEAIVDWIVDSSLHKNLPNRLTHLQCYELLGGVGHRLTYDDLEDFFAEIKSGDIKTEILRYARLPFLGKMAQSTMHLPNYWINHLIELFRNPLQAIDPNYNEPLAAELEALGLHKKRGLPYTYYDYAIKKLMNEGDRSKPEFYMSHRELIAKFIAYGDTFSTNKEMIIPIFNEKTGQLNYYKLENQVHLSGLHAYLLTPKKGDADLPAILTFRGTDGKASAHRDLDPTGVGKQTFDACKAQIMDMLIPYVKCTEHPKLEIIGHSLGAADCQRALVELTAPSNAELFESIDLFSYCSPKLDHPTVELWYKHLNHLAEQKQKLVLRFSFAHHENDIITWTGDSNLKGTENFFIQRTYLIVKSDSGVSDLMLHHTSPFFRFGNFDFSTNNRSFQLIQSYSQEALDAWVKKLEELEKTPNWYLTLKSYFVEIETAEQIRKQIEQIKQEQAKFEAFKEKNAEQSWWIWTASRALNYTLQPIAYYAYGWMIGAGHSSSSTPPSS